MNFEVDSTEAEDDDFQADLEFNTDNIVQDLSIKQTLNYFASDIFKVKMGWEYKNLKLKYIRSFAGEELFRLQSDPIIKSIFYSNIINPIPTLRMNTGFRVTDYNRYNEILFDPRIGIKYTPISDLALKASWGKYSQFLF